MDERIESSAGGRTPAEDLLARAAEDWVHPGELLDIFRRRGVEDRQVQRLAAVGLVAALVSEELVVVGDIGGVHEPWACSGAEAVLRLAREWMAREEPEVMPGELFWLDCTASGQALGEAVWAREASLG